MRLVFKAVVAAVMMLANGYAFAQADTEFVGASMLTLLAQPARNSGERVLVAGFLVLEFEGEALYLHKEDYVEGLTYNAIRLSLTPQQVERYRGLAGGYVFVEATFKKRPHSEDLFTGALLDVRDIRKILVHH